MANIKPVITLLEDGTIGAVAKCLGRNKAFSFLISRITELSPDPTFPVYPIYSYGTDNSERFELKLVKTGISIASRMQIEAAIGTHIGLGPLDLRLFPTRNKMSQRKKLSQIRTTSEFSYL